MEERANNPKKERFVPEDGVSYSAGIAYLYKPKVGMPELLLVLQAAGEKNPQKSGGFFIEKRIWKMPMGHFDESKDKDLIDAAVREFREETGFVLKRSYIDPALSVKMRMPSERPGAKFHEDNFFLVIGNEFFDEEKAGKREDNVEAVGFFPLNALPESAAPNSLGAEIAYGHRKKLGSLFFECRNNKRVQEILKFLK